MGTSAPRREIPQTLSRNSVLNGFAVKLAPLSLFLACQHDGSTRMLQPSRTKVLIRLGKSLFLGSGKATTRA